MSSMNDRYNEYVLARCIDDEAKWYWSASLVLGLGVFIAGIIEFCFQSASAFTAYLSTILSGLVFLSNLRFENSRSKAQELRRKLDLQDGFGWKIEKDEYNDLLLRCSRHVKRIACDQKLDVPYFESKEAAGPKRALHNVRESAWWSEHLSEKMFIVICTATVVVTVVAVVSMIAVLASVNSGLIKDLSVYSKLARALTSFIMLIFSLSLIKLSISYYKFSKAAARCKESANIQLKRKVKNQDRAIILMYEYFIIRSASPVLPTWLWNWYRKELQESYPYKSDDVLIQEQERDSKGIWPV